MRGVHSAVVIDVGSVAKQQVDQLVVSHPQRHLQALDRVLVGHRSGLQQHSGGGHVVVGDGEVERGLTPVVIAAAHPRVQHDVGVVMGV